MAEQGTITIKVQRLATTNGIWKRLHLSPNRLRNPRLLSLTEAISEKSEVLRIAIPGVAREAIAILVENNVLTIRVRHVVGDATSLEYRLDNVFRQFKLNEKIDKKRITANLKHGVLTLNFPKLEEVKPPKTPTNIIAANIIAANIIAAKAVEIECPDEFFDMISKGLSERAWMVDGCVTSPFLVRAALPRVSVTRLTNYLLEKESLVLVDISAFVNAEEEALSDIVFLGLYPSGAVRGISGSVYKVDKSFLIRLDDPTCFLDPDSPMHPNAFEELTHEVSLVGVRAPSYV